MRRRPFSLLLCLVAVSVDAAEIRTLDFTRDDDNYHVVSDVYIAAAPSAVYGVLIDYENLDRVSSAFLETRFIEPIKDGRGLVFLHLRRKTQLGNTIRSDAARILVALLSRRRRRF